MEPTAEWLKIWEEKREFTLAPNDLDLYFSEKKINDINVDQIDLGEISLPSGKIIVNDPLGQYLALDNNNFIFYEVKSK